MAKSARKKTGGADTTASPGNNHIVDVAHEEVAVNKETQTTTTEVQVITVEDQIRQELAKFNLADQGIAKLKEEFGDLVITGPDDKAGYKAVKEAWNLVRSKRTGLEKKGKDLRGDYTVITKAISGEEKRLTELITPLEDDLYKKWKAIDDEKDRLKKEKEEAEQKQLMARIEEVQTLGMTFADGFYQIGGTITVDVASLRQFNDEQFGKLKQAITNKKAEMDKAAADAEQQRRDQEEQQRKDREAMEKEKEELRKQRREVRLGKLEAIGMEISGEGAEERAVFQWIKVYTAALLDLSTDEWNKFLDTTTAEISKYKKEEADKQRRGSRIEKVKAMGFITKGDNFEFDNGHKTITHGIDTLIEMDDYGFGEHFKILEGMVTEANQAKAAHDKQVEEEKKALEDHKKFIAASMDRAGMLFSYTAQAFYWEDKNTAITVKFSELIPLSEPEISDKAGNLQTQIAEAKKLTADADKAAKDQAAKEENNALSDRDRFFKEVAAIEVAVNALSSANYKSKKFQTMAANLRETLTQDLQNVK